MSSHSRRLASPYTEVIACSGIPANSRRSAGSSRKARAGHQLRHDCPPSPHAGYAWCAACIVTSGSLGGPAKRL